jgi:hypothetical protein
VGSIGVDWGHQLLNMRASIHTGSGVVCLPQLCTVCPTCPPFFAAIPGPASAAPKSKPADAPAATKPTAVLKPATEPQAAVDAAAAKKLPTARNAYMFFADEHRLKIKGGWQAKGRAWHIQEERLRCREGVGWRPWVGPSDNYLLPALNGCMSCVTYAVPAEEEPSLSITDIAKRVGAKWKEMSEEEQAPFKVRESRPQSRRSRALLSGPTPIPQHM